MKQAIADLDRQRSQLRLGGRTFILDVVMQAPERFTSAVRDALEAVLPSPRLAAVRSRFHFRETCPPEELVATLDRIRMRGSQGVILQGARPAGDHHRMLAADSGRAYPSRHAGHRPTRQPAARLHRYGQSRGRCYRRLSHRAVARRPVRQHSWSLSRDFFRGEEEREMGFRNAMRSRHSYSIASRDRQQRWSR